MAIQVVWFRNDLRTRDHQPLANACERALVDGGGVLPLYVVDPRSFYPTAEGFPRIGPHRQRFLFESLRNLDCQLQAMESRLHLIVGRPEVVFASLCQDVKVEAVYFHHEFAPEETAIERDVENALRRCGVAVHVFSANTLHDLNSLPFSIDDMPEVFTAFRRQVEGTSPVAGLVDRPPRVPSVDPALIARLPACEVEQIDLKSFDAVMPQDGLPQTVIPQSEAPISETLHNDAVMQFEGGESAGWRRLEDYLWEKDLLRHYKSTRNGMLGADYSSKFSPWLAHGCLSARTIYWEVCRYEKERVKNDSTYWLKFELRWRDFFAFMVAKHGAEVFKLGGLRRRRLPWSRDGSVFEKWRQGRTGYPLIDANMRELAATGFMSNRGRQNVASFLTKNLGIDWRMGAEWFESMLIDYDPCSNYGNWNYVAGVGNDSREFRWFNTIKQSQTYDRDGKYVKYWLPELMNVPEEFIHTPWRMPARVQREADCLLGEDYPEPIVHLFESAKENERRLADSRRGRDVRQKMLW